jgi:hypothetical protein
MNKIITKNSKIPGRVPDRSELLLGELAVNTADGAIYFKSSKDKSVFKISADRQESKLTILKDIVSISILLCWLFISSVILVTVMRVSLI